MARVPWWYSFVHEWRYRAFVETHRWLPQVSLMSQDDDPKAATPRTLTPR